MKAYLHFGSGTAGPFQTVGVPVRDRADGALLVLWGRWRVVRNNLVRIGGEMIVTQVTS